MEPSLTSDVFVLKRKPNWSEKELLTLSEKVTSNIKIIKGQFGPSLTINDKNACWAHINERSVADCKKKWQDLQAATKKKEASRRSEARATGGGPPPVCNFKPWESTVLQTLTKTQVEGIEGGVDTLEDDQFGPSTSNPSDTDVATTCVEGATIPEHQAEDEGTDNESVVTRICLKDQVKKGKTRKHAMDDDEEIQVKFLKMEEEKKEELKTYRQKKIELLEKNVLATEKIADNLAKILDSLSNTQIITYENEK